MEKQIILEIERIKNMMGIILEASGIPGVLDKILDKIGIKATSEITGILDNKLESLLTKTKLTSFENNLLKLTKITDEAAFTKAFDNFVKKAENHIGIANLIKKGSPEVYGKMVGEFVAPKLESLSKNLGQDITDFSKFADEGTVTKWAENLSQRYENTPLAKQFFEDWGKKHFNDLKLRGELKGPELVTPENVGSFLETKKSAYPVLFKKGFLGFGFKNPSAIKGLKDELLLNYKGKPVSAMINEIDSIINKHQELLKRGLGEEGQRQVNSLWANTKEAFNPYRKHILSGKAEVDPAFLKNVVLLSTISTALYFLIKHNGNVIKAGTDIGIDTGKDVYRQLKSIPDSTGQQGGGGQQNTTPPIKKKVTI